MLVIATLLFAPNDVLVCREGLTLKETNCPILIGLPSNLLFSPGMVMPGNTAVLTILDLGKATKEH